MSQEQLISHLRSRGYSETKRTLTNWRQNDVLPPFDLPGAGLGKGQGRESWLWSNGEAVLNQAMWVRRLLTLYTAFQDCYLPLWMLGYPVPFAGIRNALYEPLRQIAEAINSEAKNADELEELIDDSIYGYAKTMKQQKAQLLQVPSDTLAAFINLLLNREYKLNDDPFERGISELRGWQHQYQMRMKDHIPLAASEVVDRSHSQTAEAFFANAPFIKSFLSVDQLRQAVEESSDDDLRIVERDLSVLRDVSIVVREIVQHLMPNVEAELEAANEHLLRGFFFLGRLVVLVDLSLRRNGFGDVIDRALLTLSSLKEEVNSSIQNELSPKPEEVAAAIRRLFERLELLWTQS